ncbi:Zinc transporter ZIP9 [Trichinella nativa]|uniref:Zinc transporter ZIP9 n=1 Tax=Trichinella nativa TaxID=6335 RepID=A0A0V1L199_9BILA|nr:Zinc transporter ZIP9 [Trichinella nativa]
MAEAFSVLLLSVFMFIGSLMIGIVPTIVSLPENRIKLSGALGAGLLVGTALGVIVPEGIHAIHASPHLKAEGKHFDHYENIPISKDVNVVKQFIPRPKGIFFENNTENTAMGKADLHTAQENWLMHDCSAVNFEGKSRIIGVTLLYGFLFMFLIEHITERYTHGNDRGRVRIHHGWMATIGLIVHSATDGIALGAAAFADSSVTFIIFLAVLLHKAPAAFGLSTYLLNEGFEKSKIRKLLIIFSSSAPLATLLTFAGISQAQISHSASSSSNVIGILLLISAGSFLFVATVHILPEVTEGASGLYYAYHSVIYSLRFSKMIERNTCSLENLNSATDKFDKQSVESDRMIHMHPKYSNPAALWSVRLCNCFVLLSTIQFRNSWSTFNCLVGNNSWRFYSAFGWYVFRLLKENMKMMFFLKCNSFAYACFGTFGGIWICFGLLLFHSNNSEVDAIRMDIAHFIAKENAVYLEYLSAGFSMSACLIALYIVGHFIFLGSENEKFWPLGRTFYEIMKQKKTNKKKQNANIENSPQS